MVLIKIFTDYYNNKVNFSTEDHPFSKEPKHVWVICRLGSDWLLTRHSSRGIEFPGGKVEVGETAEEAAIREVYEETGGKVKDLFYIGQYKVEGKTEVVIKNVYYALIGDLIEKSDYHETEGPLLLNSLPANIRSKNNYSFIMKDDVLELSLTEVMKRYLSFPSKTR
ncbi:RNA deprotection pyrophosphohydrolase [Litchfieldia alkalitelluris]